MLSTTLPFLDNKHFCRAQVIAYITLKVPCKFTFQTDIGIHMFSAPVVMLLQIRMKIMSIDYSVKSIPYLVSII